MLVTQDALEKEVIRVAAEAMLDFKLNGHIEPSLLFFCDNMSQCATVHIGCTCKMIGEYRITLKKAVQRENPEAIMLTYQAEVGVNYFGINEGTGLTDYPKDRTIIRIEASSPVANYELLVFYKKDGHEYVFDHTVNVPVERGGCEHTRDVWRGFCFDQIRF